MTIEQQYYEDEAFWADEFFHSQTDRFEGIANLIPQAARSVLDVGSGNGAFVHLLSGKAGRFDEIHAADRSATALSRVKTAKTQASIDDLPFKDRSYDVVTCLEVLEHLPEAVFEAGLGEIARVAGRYAILSVPNDEDLEATFIACTACRTRFNPDYHMRRFNENRLRGLLTPHGFKVVDVLYLGPKKHYIGLTSLLERRARGNGEENHFPVAVPCPVCGHVLPPAKGASAPKPQGEAPAHNAAASSPRRGGPLGLVKSLLPSETRYGHVAALYERA